MKRCVVPLPISVPPPGRGVRFLGSRLGAFYLGFCSACILAGVLAALPR